MKYVVHPRSRNIFAADEIDEDLEIEDTIDNIADDISDIQDDIEDVVEDDPTIDVDNNIAGKYIAECDRCHGLFISAVAKSEQEIESVTGKCPLCDHETTQYLKWVIQDVNEWGKQKS